MSQMRKFFVKNVKVFRLYFLVIKRHLMKALLLKKKPHHGTLWVDTKMFCPHAP